MALLDKKSTRSRSKTKNKKLSSRRNNKNSNTLTRLKLKWARSTKTTKMVAFAAIFALIGGGALLYSYAADITPRLPTGAKEIVIKYDIGMAHIQKQEDFTTGMPPAMLLYANGLMLCGDGMKADDPLSIRQRQLSSNEMQQIFDNVVAKGFFEISDMEQSGDTVHPTAVGRFIQLNTTQGAGIAAAYPDEELPQFKLVEEYLKQECTKATEPYDPDNIVVETITLSENRGRSKLPKNVQYEDKVRGVKSEKFSGSKARTLKKSLTRKAKDYKANNGKSVKARYLPVVPEYEVPNLIPESSKGKVSAATSSQTRWLYVVAKDQTTPSNASSMIGEHASSIRSWYRDRTGKYMTNAQVSVVRSSKTASQLRSCPAGRSCTDQVSLAIFYNMVDEYKKAGYNTNILHSIPGSGADGCKGLGTNQYGMNQNTSTVSYGLGVTTLVGCNWSEGSHLVAAHEGGHGFSLAHTCDGNLMDGCGYARSWPWVGLTGSQAVFLRDKSPFFNDTTPPPPPPPAPEGSTDRFGRGTKIYAGKSYYSSNGRYRLVMQSDGNLVLYYLNPTKAVWSTGTWGNKGAYAVFQGDGNFVVYRPGKSACHTGTYGKGGTVMIVQGDGNLVMYGGGKAVWDSKGYTTNGFYC